MAFAIWVACRVSPSAGASSPGRPADPSPTFTAITRMFVASSAAMVWATVCPLLGSCDGASPNQAMIFVSPGRKFTAGPRERHW
ncbi:MAG TPA: hypothetical protein VFW65_05710 [Pseudonocardiaceae bacterium]|nr:hypothetical protein [Pseudonocardiaceae bacterium]